MWSSNRHDERLLDIACRKSTPNSLDDTAGQELGEVNLLLEQRFSQPVPPPQNLDWEAVTRLIMTAPAPAPPLPWWKVALQPGQLAAACAIAGLAVAAFVALPIYPTSVPGLEGTVYARGNEALTPLPAPAQLLPEKSAKKHRTMTFTKEVTVGSDEAGHHIRIDIEKHIKSPVPLGAESTDVTPTELHQQTIREYGKILQTEDISGAIMMEEVREMNTKAGGAWKFSVSPKQIEIEKRVSMMEAFKQRFGGEGFLPDTGKAGQRQIIVLDNDSLQHLNSIDFERMSDEDLLLLMEQEMKRLRQADADEAEATAEADSAAPRTTGRQP